MVKLPSFTRRPGSSVAVAETGADARERDVGQIDDRGTPYRLGSGAGPADLAGTRPRHARVDPGGEESWEDPGYGLSRPARSGPRPAATADHPPDRPPSMPALAEADPPPEVTAGDTSPPEAVPPEVAMPRGSAAPPEPGAPPASGTAAAAPPARPPETGGPPEAAGPPKTAGPPETAGRGTPPDSAPAERTVIERTAERDVTVREADEREAERRRADDRGSDTPKGRADARAQRWRIADRAGVRGVTAVQGRHRAGAGAADLADPPTADAGPHPAERPLVLAPPPQRADAAHRTSVDVAAIVATLGLVVSVAAALFVLTGLLAWYGVGLAIIGLLMSMVGLLAGAARPRGGRLDALLGTALGAASLLLGTLVITDVLPWLNTQTDTVSSLRGWMDNNLRDRF